MGNCSCFKVKSRPQPLAAVVADEVRDRITDPFPNILIYDSSVDENSDFEYTSIATPDISLELESSESEPDRVYIDGDTCGICANNFDNYQYRPWILPCGHLTCYYCVRKLARKNNFKMFECPLDRKVHKCKRNRRRNTNRTDEVDDLISLEVFDNFEPVSAIASQTSTDNARASSQTTLPGHTETNHTIVGDHSHRDVNSTIPDSALVFNRYTQSFPEDLVEQHADLRRSRENDSKRGEVVITQNEHASQVNSINSLPEQHHLLNDGASGILNIHDLGNNWTFRTRAQLFQTYMGDGRQTYNEMQLESDVPMLYDVEIKDIEREEKADLYADERSIRSYQWVEPDYPSDGE